MEVNFVLRLLPYSNVYIFNLFHKKIDLKCLINIFYERKLWGPIDPIGTICIGKGWAYGLISSPRIRKYPMTTSKGRDENYVLKRGKQYLCRI